MRHYSLSQHVWAKNVEYCFFGIVSVCCVQVQSHATTIAEPTLACFFEEFVLSAVKEGIQCMHQKITTALSQHSYGRTCDSELVANFVPSLALTAAIYTLASHPHAVRLSQDISNLNQPICL